MPFLVLQRDGKVLETVSGSDAGKVSDAVERHAGKSGNTGKLGLPPALDATPRENGGMNPNGGSGEVSKDLSGYAPGANDAKTAPEMSSKEGDTEELNKRLEELVKAAPVMLFMKGTPSTPQCGFSRQLVGLLRENGVRYGFFNILADEEVRQGLKVWADWPTFPQLWVGGELVGGLDIVSSLSTWGYRTGTDCVVKVKEEVDSDPDFFKEYSAGKGKGGMAAPEAQSTPATASA